MTRNRRQKQARDDITHYIAPPDARFAFRMPPILERRLPRRARLSEAHIYTAACAALVRAADAFMFTAIT